jgi:hypothetical protein
VGPVPQACKEERFRIGGAADRRATRQQKNKGYITQY